MRPLGGPLTTSGWAGLRPDWPWSQARAALSAAIDLYHAMEMTFWLPQAEAVLAQVGRYWTQRRERTRVDARSKRRRAMLR